MSGTGNNFSLIVGGAVGRSGDPDRSHHRGPTPGPTANPASFSTRTRAQWANYGFDAEAGDAATIAINGVVYNASLPGYGASAPSTTGTE